jgi:hypothetical protein
MSLEVSTDGLNFVEMDKWDEAYLDNDFIEANNVN